MSPQTAKPIILVTQQEWDKGRAIFEGAADEFSIIPVAADEAALSEAARQKGALAVIVGVDPYTGPLYTALPKGGVIARFGVGFDSVDQAQATAQQLVVCNTPGVLDSSVAEHAIWLLGALARPILQTSSALKAGDWKPASGREVGGQTLAVVGYGRIGRRVASVAGLGLGMRVIGYDYLPLETMLRICGVARAEELASAYGTALYTTDLQAALAQADYVTVHLAVTPETRGYFSRERLALMKRGACLINTARGALIDENALYDALASGHLGGAALDVFQSEPYRPVDPQRDLRTLSNVILTPHIGSNTTAANARMATQSLANIRAVLEKRWKDANVVNQDVLKVLS